MADQKIENQLNLALEASSEERRRSQWLEVGYDSEEKTWELIVKYSGSFSEIFPGAVEKTELLSGYAILVVPEALIPVLAEMPEIEYIEKPRRLFFARSEGKRASCMTPVQRPPLALSGKGVLTAVLDSGVDYRHPEFLNPDGTTRIRALWDQTGQGPPPRGYHRGTEYSREQINAALAGEGEMPSTEDLSGHGTGVLAIAAGRNGVAYDSEILAVRLGMPGENGFPRTTELMTGLDYVIRRAQEYQMPVAVNISFGNTYGSHRGNSLLETFLDAAGSFWKTVICIGSGNEGSAAGHTGGTLSPDSPQNVSFVIGSYETSLSLQLWKHYVDTFKIYVIHPDGSSVGPLYEQQRAMRYRLGDTELLIYYGEPAPYSLSQEIYLEFLPVKDYVDSGVWSLYLIPEKIVEGDYEMWLPSFSVTGRDTRFLYPVEYGTLTIPSTAQKAITVGAYHSSLDIYADFSGRGGVAGVQKPDLVAPGVDIRTASPGGGYRMQTGTSFAAPFVTGAAALLMQWGITDGNDPYLYGEKVKAYLRRGARPLPAFTEYPNPTIGYGALCVEASLP